MKSMCVRKGAEYLCVLLLILAMICSLVGCRPPSDMPYNGDITFHKLTMTIPSTFIRDSTQSSNDVWLFEKGYYDQLIILSRKDITGETDASLDGYVEYMSEQGAKSERTTFLEYSAVLSEYTKDDQFCQEMLFAYNGSFYAIALRGGTQQEFQTLLNTVSIMIAPKST